MGQKQTRLEATLPLYDCKKVNAHLYYLSDFWHYKQSMFSGHIKSFL